MKKLFLSFVCLIFLIGNTLSVSAQDIEGAIPLNKELIEHTILLAEENNIEPTILFSIMEKESTFKTEARGAGGTYIGLMQVSVSNGHRFNQSHSLDVYNYYDNIEIATLMINISLEEGYSIEEALSIYNTGSSYSQSGARYANKIIVLSEKYEEEVTLYKNELIKYEKENF